MLFARSKLTLLLEHQLLDSWQTQQQICGVCPALLMPSNRAISLVYEDIDDLLNFYSHLIRELVEWSSAMCIVNRL